MKKYCNQHHKTPELTSQAETQELGQVGRKGLSVDLALASLKMEVECSERIFQLLVLVWKVEFRATFREIVLSLVESRSFCYDSSRPH